MNKYHSQKILTIGDPLLDLIACIWAQAFKDAEAGDRECRQAVIDQFGFQRVKSLYEQNLITWDPSMVVMQLTMGV